MNIPLISVIIPVLNGEAFLQDAIDCVIAQNYPSIEILVIDNASTDNTSEIARSNSVVHYYYQSEIGPSATKNLGISMAKGEYLAFLDCDDLWTGDSLVKLCTFLVKNPFCEIVQGSVQEMRRLNANSPFTISSEPYYFTLPGSCLFRASVFEKVGLFDEKLIYSENADWFIRAWELGISKQLLPFTCLYYRKHEMNMTNDTSSRNHYRLKLFKNRLTRLRSMSNDLKPIGEMSDYLCDESFKEKL